MVVLLLFGIVQLFLVGLVLLTAAGLILAERSADGVRAGRSGRQRQRGSGVRPSSTP